MPAESIQSLLLEKYHIVVRSAEPLHGGSINEAYKLTTDSGCYFLKINRNAPPGFFAKEALGLETLRESGTDIKIPKVIAFEPAGKNRPGFLLLEYIAPRTNGNFFRFGRQLAQLHQTKAETFGLSYDNFIGSLRQKNTQTSSWAEFFAACRIEPLLKKAVDKRELPSEIQKNWQRLAAKLDDIFPPTFPSLLHGDLWSGNVMFDENGNAVLIDPAVYYGHPEVDLAFTKMFGGFSDSFYEGYQSATPIEPDFEKRADVYNLCPMLVHAVLFGGHYSQSVSRLLQKF